MYHVMRVAQRAARSGGKGMSSVETQAVKVDVAGEFGTREAGGGWKVGESLSHGI